MAQRQPLISNQYPYLPIRVELRGQTVEDLALIDTGYDGSFVIPAAWRDRLGRPDGISRVGLGDGSIVAGTPIYIGVMEMRRRQLSQTGNKAWRWLRQNLFSLIAWYRFVSLYGERYIQERLSSW